MEQLEDEQSDFGPGKFKLADYIVFSLMLIISIGIGLYSAFTKDNSTKKEFLAGGKSMPVVPVALSLIGGAVSAIAILGKTFRHTYFFVYIDFINIMIRHTSNE